MDSFPSDFNFVKVEEKLHQQVANSEETAKWRKVISDNCNQAIANKAEYFRISLKNVSVPVKMRLVNDLFERNFRIAYINNQVNETDIFTALFTGFQYAPNAKVELTDKLPEGKRHIVELKKGTFVDADEYIIPITTHFADKMTSYLA